MLVANYIYCKLWNVSVQALHNPTSQIIVGTLAGYTCVQLESQGVAKLSASKMNVPSKNARADLL
jgi:hypothetical protein